MSGLIDLKKDLRKKFISARHLLSAAEVSSQSFAVQKNIRSLPVWQEASEVLLYLPINNEVDTWPLLYELWEREVRVLLPCCRSEEEGIMDLAYVRHAQEIKPGAFNIPEPDRQICQMLDNFHPDIILLPGVGFDRQGFRLGYGGGYYDRFLSHPHLAQTLFLGIAFEFQLVEELPVEDWDKPVHAVITNQEILWTN